MTLQIVVHDSGGQPVIELHGWLRGAVIVEFKDACEHRPLPLRIDLENLSGASADGILALKEQRARGAVLTGASPYIELLLAVPGKSAPDTRRDS